ncbi:hypothetical protein MAR_020488, partial [Mya arenaria]
MLSFLAGRYFVAVRAMNKIHFGGFLGTTICHSVPYTIDITSPCIYEIYDIKYAEDSFRISALHNSTDEESGIAHLDACLGGNPRSCSIMSWSRRPILPYVEFSFKIPDGIPAWLRLRATNNVDLHVVERANRAILVDASPPIAGVINDGEIYAEDLQFTKYFDKICTNWYDFHDPESGISKYEIGVGSIPGGYNVAGLENVNYHEHLYCFHLHENASLVHDDTYYVVIWASNAATNMKNVSKYSNGVRVDLTEPLAGNVIDGALSDFKDKKYSHSKSTVQVQWNNFYDPESGIRSYSASVEKHSAGTTDTITVERGIGINASTAVWKNLNLKHLDYIQSTITAINGALNENSSSSDGMLIDLTTPNLEFLYDGETLGIDVRYQSSIEDLSMNFKVYDVDSGITELKAQIYIEHQGSTKQFYPEENGKWIPINNPNCTYFKQNKLILRVGAKYKFRLGAVNGAGLISTFETDGVIIDNTPPKLGKLQVGVLSGDDEERVFGFVWQSDHSGIKSSWVANDHESGIQGVRYAVGTSNGSDGVVNWVEQDNYAKDLYIHCTLNDTDTSDPNNYFPVYYVSIEIKNGAGLWSSRATSTAIVIVPEDVTGIAVDGPQQGITHDIDYQGDLHTVTMSFSGFESSLHGIHTYDWAIGTSPQGEDVQPYLEYGISHTETESSDHHGLGSAGQAQVTLALVPGQTYFTTLRAITNGGNIMQTTTDAFIADITPPHLRIQTFGSGSPSTKPIYQQDSSSLSGSWSYSDDEIHDVNNVDNILVTWFSIGTFPFSTEITGNEVSNTSVAGTSFIPVKNIRPALQGVPNILSVAVENKAKITSKAYSQSLIQDNSGPVPGFVECHEYIQSHFNITCEWSGFVDLESRIEKYFISFGFQEGFDNLAHEQVLSGDVHYFTTTAAISVDDTPPSSGVVVELKSGSNVDPNNSEKTVNSAKMACVGPAECSAIDAVCQETLNTIRVAWSPINDPESGIKSMHISIGTVPGGGQIKPFFPISHDAQNYVITNIDLNGEIEVFATIKAENNAGKVTSIISNGVFMSYLSQGKPPLHHVGIYDYHQNSHGDIDFQVETSLLEAKWDVSGDPCPATKYEWAIESTGGRIIQNFTDMYTSTHGVNDQLDVEEGERYYSLLRVTNAIGYSYTVRSNGVTISSDLLIPGEVYDGSIIGYDVSVQQSRTNVSANWDAFGKGNTALMDEIETGNEGLETEMDKSMDIAYYEVALGTDRRFPQTRDDVVPFTNVGQNTSTTFRNLDLEAGNAIYYFTVKAYSKTYATALALSNGFYVNFQGGVTVGEINMQAFVNKDYELQFSWSGFDSKVEIMLYYIGVSTGLTNESDCRKYVVKDERTVLTYRLFDIVDVMNVKLDTRAQIENLNLIHNHTYYAWVLGVDKSGECNMTHKRFLVDITPPTNGKITAGPYYDMAIAYSSRSDQLSVRWKDFADKESGIANFNVTLWTSSHCSIDEKGLTLTPIVTYDVLPNYENITLYNISLKRDTVYFVSIEAVNNAALKTVAFTSTILYDNSKPSPGYVAEGTNIKEDVVWWGNDSSIKGIILHYPLWVDDACPQQDMPMNDDGWRTLDIKHINDPNGIQWGLIYRPANVHLLGEDEIKIKMARDTKFKQWYSGAYTRSASFVMDGLYEISINTGDNDGYAVTGLTFWDGESDDLHLFDHRPVDNWASIDECLCCRSETEVDDCPCNCTEYWNNLEINTTYTSYNETSTSKPPPVLNDNSGIPAQRACGIQIYGGSNPYVVTWCRFFNTTYRTMSVTSEIQFNPTLDYHKYTIKFSAHRDDLRVTQCVHAFADQQELSEMCGIPELSNTTMLVLNVWNKNNFIPEMSIFDSWTTYSYFKLLKIPPKANELCRYGSPWLGGTVAVISYFAGIGSSPSKPDIVDFRKVIEPCIPCVGMCSELICHSDCEHKRYTAIQFSLDQFMMKDSFIVVKSILGSGEEALSASNGFYIDTTPPTFDLQITFYIDVRQGEFTETEYQGSNDTIKAVWFCEDAENEIKLRNTLQFENESVDILEGILEHNKTYYISVKCINEADLTAVYYDTRGVTVLLEAPSADSINSSAVNAESFGENVYPATALETSDPTSCGEQWSESSDDTVERYGTSIDRNFCVGSSKDIPDDVVPCIWVAINSSGIAEIKNGHIYVNGEHYYKLSELQAFSKAHYTLKDNVNKSQDNFLMEPGRTVFLFMRMCNKAQICSFKLSNSVIVKGNESTLTTSKGGNETSVILGQHIDTKQKRSSENNLINVTFPRGMNDGQSVLLKELTDVDLKTVYESDASPTFKAFIVDPFETFNKTERLLYRRIYHVDNSFVISPIGQEEMPGAVEITHSQIHSDFDDPNSNITMLIHWNPDAGEWQISSKTCPNANSTEEFYKDVGITIVKVCNTRNHNKSDGTEMYLYKETQFVIATVRASPFNSPPVLVSPLKVSLQEDSEPIVIELLVQDDELDKVMFSAFRSQMTIGFVELNISGLLRIEPCVNCYGQTTLDIDLVDIPAFDEILPAKSTGKVEINVVEINDPPTALLYSMDGQYLLESDPTEPVIVNCSALNIPDAKVYKIQYVIKRDELQNFGIEHLKLVARDSRETYSDVISLELWIMAMKCINGGQCRSIYPNQYSCNDAVRTEGFDKHYACNCPNEWTGAYCEDDVDECLFKPCKNRQA